ncbi:class I SAM-dependent methyltransferase [Xanthovirga aplysinae]|uniref:class I SAM-dependent methyltransferase n=1 Tax=Xanthovirga aplysinae TaxID=2529853 RepID=UPI0012BBC566|nr:class I SAM-dependent methyltransferase [Xanthovirga aplysinae]MTI31975.1 class I SAM-dependent methyltransferase [Xanthovirga aplysinae]
MDKKTLNEKPEEIASQLSCPKGDSGIEMGKVMHKTNIGMTLSTIDSLNLSYKDILLELGHGNCGHLTEILNRAEDVKYMGLEISSLMQQEAEKLNLEAVKKKMASFTLYNGINIPFENNSIDKVMTVNTLYFWERPIDLLNEIYRVLKNGGKCSITFAQKRFMKNLTFVQHGFELYDTNKAKGLLAQTPFRILNISNYIEEVKSKTGELVEREYSIVILEKCEK